MDKKIGVKILPIFHICDYDCGDILSKNMGYAMSPEILFRKFSENIDSNEYIEKFSYGKHSVYFSSAVAIRLTYGNMPISNEQRIQCINGENEQNPFTAESGLQDLKFHTIIKNLQQGVAVGDQKLEQFLDILKNGILFSQRERLALNAIMDQLKLKKIEDETLIENDKIQSDQYKFTNQIIKNQGNTIGNIENLQDMENQVQELQDKNQMQQAILKYIQKKALKDTNLQEILNEAVEQVNTHQPNNEEQISLQTISSDNTLQNRDGQRTPLKNKNQLQLQTLQKTPDTSSKKNMLTSNIDDMKNVTNLIKEMKKNNNKNKNLGHIIETNIRETNQDIIKNSEYAILRSYQDKSSIGTNTIKALNREYVAEAGDSKEIKIWEWESGSIINILTGHSQEINTICVLMSNILASGSNSIKIWDTVTGLCLKTLTTLETRFTQIIKLDSDYIASSSLDCKIRIFQWKQNQLFRTLSGHQMPVLSICTLDSNHMASGSDDCCLRIWDWRQGKCEKIELLHKSYINQMILIDQIPNTLATGNGDGTVKIIDYQRIKTLHTFDNHLGEVTALVYIKAENRLVSGGQDSSVVIYDLINFSVIQVIEDVGTMITCLTYYKNNNSYAIITGGACDTLYEIDKIENDLKLNRRSSNKPQQAIRGKELSRDSLPRNFTTDSLKKQNSIQSPTNIKIEIKQDQVLE